MKTADSISRRTFVKGVVASGIALSGVNLNADAKITSRQKTAELSGTIFHLNIDKTAVNITGKPSFATTLTYSP